MNVPGGANVSRALVALTSSLKGCLRQVNEHAGKLLAKGDYTRAEACVEVAKAIESFRTEVESLRGRWRTIKGVRESKGKEAQTPLWEFYQPILRALEGLGGTARIGELEAAVGDVMKDLFLEGDLGTVARGKPRWQIMIRKARKYMVKEGLLETDTGPQWRITSAGSKAAATASNRLTAG